MALTVVRGRLDQNAVSGNDHIVLQDEQVTNLDVLALYLLRVIHVTLCFVPLVHTLCLETALATGLTEGIHAPVGEVNQESRECLSWPDCLQVGQCLGQSSCSLLSGLVT